FHCAEKRQPVLARRSCAGKDQRDAPEPGRISVQERCAATTYLQENGPDSGEYLTDFAIRRNFWQGLSGGPNHGTINAKSSVGSCPGGRRHANYLLLRFFRSIDNGCGPGPHQPSGL